VSRPAHIRLLSRTAHLYDAVVHPMGFSRLWEAVANRAGSLPAGTCLDVCTGTGGVALALGRRGMRVVGQDLASGMLERADRKARSAGLDGRLRWVRMDSRQLAFPDRSFPLVTCCMALHEMAEEERLVVLAEIRRVASGRVLIADYRVPSLPWRRTLFRAVHVFEYLESDDFGSFTRADLRARLEQAGLLPEAPRDDGPYRIWSCRVESS
jgi:ubiquinone/menaquinone biosynthesis C-methylase UbiE